MDILPKQLKPGKKPTDVLAYKSHYDWLEENLMAFLMAVVNHPDKANKGMIVAHGDKCYSAAEECRKRGVPFVHFVAIYLLTYISPFSSESRETIHTATKESEWVPPYKWVLDNYERFKPYLPPAYMVRQDEDPYGQAT